MLKEKRVKREIPLKALQEARQPTPLRAPPPDDHRSHRDHRREDQGDLEARPPGGASRSRPRSRARRSGSLARARTTFRRPSARSRSTTSGSPCSSRTTGRRPRWNGSKRIACPRALPVLLPNPGGGTRGSGTGQGAGGGDRREGRQGTTHPDHTVREALTCAR